MPAQVGVTRILTLLRGSETGLLLLALVAGAGAGGGAVAFRWLITTLTQVLSGHRDYSSAGGSANPLVPWLGPYFVLLAPVAAGAVYGPLVYFFAREARGHGVPEVMYAVVRRGGRIAPRVAAVKALASALCIGGGGSVGREGPIVQIGSALGSTVGGLVRVNEDRMRVLVACGAAGGIAATFNAPLAGVFFAMELILRDFAAQAFGMVVLASVTASVIGRAAFGDQPFLQLPAFVVAHLYDFALFAALGVVAGLVGVVFTRVLYLVEDACDRVWRGPEWLRPAVGGVVLGALLLVMPKLYGVGYPVLSAGVAGAYSIGLALALLAGKILATSVTMGIGGSGGVFAPSLFMGAMLGSAFGQLVSTVAPGVAGPVGAYGLIGMGAVFAGAARAPITAVVIMFELTGEYGIILPLMVAISLATGISHVLSRDTIYTLKLTRRGVDLNRPVDRNVPARRVLVGQVMSAVPPPLSDDTPLTQAAAALADTRFAVLPVVDVSGSYRGTVTSRAVLAALADGNHDRATVAEFCELPPTVTADAAMEAAIDALDRSGGTAVPVLDPTGRGLVGWLTTQAALAAIRPSAPPSPPVTERRRNGPARTR